MRFIPAAIAVARERPGIATGALRSDEWAARASDPLSSIPQHFTVPVRMTAHVCVTPGAMTLTAPSPRSGHGTAWGPAGQLIVSPFWPRLMSGKYELDVSPQHLTTPPFTSTQVELFPAAIFVAPLTLRTLTGVVR